MNFYKRQIFITVSPYFRRKVKEDFDYILDSATDTEKKMSMKQCYEYRKKKEKKSSKLHEEEDDENEYKGIPDTFDHQQLTDDCFPLFIDFEKFSKMLQGTYGISNQDLIIQKKLDADNIDSYDKKKEIPNNFVNYNRFRTKYWPSLCDYCKQKFDCELVYSEFSIIKVCIQ